jgi:peptide/nickel transport system substrate-binding protein
VDGKPGAPKVDPVKYRWFSNREFRRAVSMAIDRDAIIGSVYFGDGARNWSAPSVGNRKWGSHGITGPDYDPAGARRILDGLGWKDQNGDGVREDDRGHPIRFTMITNSDATVRIAILNFLREDLAKVGIQCTALPLEFNTMVTRVRTTLDYDACLGGLGSASPPDPGMYANFVRSSGLTHYWNIKQPSPQTPAEAALDSLYEHVIGSNDDAARLRAWKQIVQRINDECLVIWLPVSRAKLPVRNRFGNVRPVGIPHRILWNAPSFYVKPRG